jgi:polysaccharide export outer membrane protein
MIISALLLLLLAAVGCHTPDHASGEPDPAQEALAASNLIETASSIRSGGMDNGESSFDALPMTTAHGVGARLPLLAGDAVSIRFGYSTNYNTIQKISMDGRLNLVDVGEVHAAGLTPGELQSELQRRYEPILRSDTVTVNVVESSAAVYVLGAVLQPGRLPLEHPMSVLEVLAAVGGFDSRRAQLTEVRVFRVVDGKQEHFHLDLKRILTGEIMDLFLVEPFDIVYVPARKFNF